MRTCRRLLAFALTTGLVACEGGGAGADRARLDALASRVDQLEKRVAEAERGSEPVERLQNDAASLDRRVSTLETSVRELAARPAGGGAATPPAAGPSAPAAANGGAPGTPGSPVVPPARAERPPTGDLRMERRTQLRALSDEFRAKVAELRSQPQDSQQQSAQELLQWYREQRRAILRTGARTDQ